MLPAGGRRLLPAMITPGPRNLITDVDGILVGNAEDQRVRSGATVVLPEVRAVTAVDVRGGAPGTRETDALDAACLVEAVDAVVLSGGSAFGLDAAQGVMLHLAAMGRGFAVAGHRIPIVPAAILFDLANGGDKGWGELPPYRDLGAAAAEAAGTQFRLGNAGAGLGAKAGTLKGGLGSVSAILPGGIQVGALAAVNPLGSVVMPDGVTFWAWALEQEDELGGQPPPRAPASLEPDLPFGALATAAANTTIAVVATNAMLSRPEAGRLAIMAQDGFARAIRPSHTPFDGDTVFAIATGTMPLPEPRPVNLAVLGSVAADCIARAVARGIYEAASLGEIESYRDRRQRLAG